MRGLALGVLVAGVAFMAAAQEPDTVAPPASERPGIPPLQQPPAEQHDQRGAASDTQTDSPPEPPPPASLPVEAKRQQEPADGLGQAEGNQDAVRDAGPRALAWVALPADLKFTEALAAGAAAFAVFVAYLQVRIARRQADIMLRQADIAEHTLRETAVAAAVAKDSLILSQRPWIVVEATIVGPLRNDANGLNVTLQVRMTNIGPTPALRVFPSVRAYLRTQKNFDIAKQQTAIVEDNFSKASYKHGNLVARGQTFITNISVCISPEEITAAIVDRQPRPDKRFEVIVVGAVGYFFSFADEMHQTGFSYSLFERDPEEPRPAWIIDISRDEVPAERLFLADKDFITPYID